MEFPEFKFFGETLSKKIKDYINLGSENFKNFIHDQKILRCYIQGGTAYGHHAASVNFVRRLCSDPSENNRLGCGYEGTIEIYLGDDQGAEKKIKELIPELNEKDEGKLIKATIQIKKDLLKNPPTSVANFGFCGACDNIDGEDGVSFLEKTFNPLNVSSFLMLQPYKWDKIEPTKSKLYPGNLIFYNKLEEDKLKVNFVNLEKGEKFKRNSFGNYKNIETFDSIHQFNICNRGFHTEITDLDNGKWEAILNQSQEPIKKFLTILKILTSQENTDKYNIVPLYGFNYPDPTAFRTPVSHRLALILVSYHTALKNGANIKPPIIINFSPYVPNNKPEMKYEKIKDLAQGGQTLKETIAANDKSKGEYKIKRNEEILENAERRKKAFDSDPSKGEFFKLVEYQDINDIKSLLKWLKSESNRVLFIQGDRVPPTVFNYVINKAGLPPIFEGNNTALPAIAAGKPYFHVCDPNHMNENRYPPGDVGVKDAKEIISEMQLTANKIQDDFDNWPTNLKDSANHIICKTLQKIYNYTNNDYFEYFGSIKEFFADPINDKINICSSLYGHFCKDISQTKFIYMMTNELPPLEKFYNQINSKIDKNAINLLQDILKSGGIHEYFISMLKLSGGQLIVKKASVEVHKDDESQIDRVILKGETLAFDVLTECTFIFTLQMNEIACNGSFVAEEPWSLEGIPWIVFKKPTFNTLSSNAALPPGGSISAILQGPEVEISLALPDNSGRAIATGKFENPVSIASFMSFVGGININEYVPEPIQKLANIGVKDIEFAYNTKSNSLDYIALDIGSTESWTLLDRLKVENANVHVIVNSPGDLKNRSVTAALSGELLIGTDEKVPRIDLGATIPGLQLSGQLASKELPLNTLLGVFWPNVSPPWPGGKEPAITGLSVSYNGTSGDYMVDTTMDLHWPIEIAETKVLTINYISLHLMGGKEWANGYLSGSFALLPDGPNIGLLLIGSYLGNGAGWRFEAQQTSGTVDIADLLKKYLYWDTDLNLGIAGLSLKVETDGPSFEFSGKTANDWHIPIGTGIPITGNMKIGYNGGSEQLGVAEKPCGKAQVPVHGPNNRIMLAVANDGEKTKGYFGQISAEIEWNGIDLTVFGNFNPVQKESKTIYEMAFGISWGILKGLLSEKEIEGKKHQIASLTFEESTNLGSIIETMVSWAIGSKLSLSAPWDILDKIPLTDFELDWDFTDETVKLQVNIGPIDLKFVTIKSIGITYDKDPEEQTRKRVMVDLDASFVWGEKIPAWDATKPETTPSPRGSGNRFLDLHMLAMGQHVTFEGYKGVESVQKAIELMETMPEPKPDEVPAITFDPNSSWLFGADFGVLRIDPPKPENQKSLVLADKIAPLKPSYVLTLQTVFNDPNLYALRIALDGDAAKIFKGLDFQIMYKKLSENIGVYKAEIILPDKMRYIKAGSFNITLPVFGIEIYTTGDFKVDIGFPWNEDFTRSFSICGIVMAGPIPVPLTGAGGIYFGKVPQIATSNVPEATNGLFNPILVFGFGAQFGLGYEVHYGLLNAGFSLTLFGILEGVLAKWNPYDGKSSGDSEGLQIQGEYFFWVRGTFGIIGRIFGNVDFSVIKVDVELTIKIYAQITFASYEPIPISIVASVDTSASITIKIGFFKIHLHFSFSVRIKETIKIDAAQGDAPWLVAAATNKGRLASPMANRLSGNKLALFTMVNETPWTPHWGSLAKPESPAQLSGYMSFALTVAGDSAYSKNNPPDLKKQAPCYVASMFIKSVPSATLDDFTSESKALGDTPDTSFEKLAKLVSVWAIASLTDKGQNPEQVLDSIVSEEDLKNLEKYFYDTKDHPTPVPAENINKFLTDQVFLTLSMPKESGEEDAAFFPMALPLSLERLAYGDTPQINYSLEEFNAIDPDFIPWLREYFNQLAIQVQKETGKTSKAILLDSNSDISVGNFVFTDYFLLIMRQMIKSLSEGLRTFKRPIDLSESCNDILAWVTKTGKLDEGVFTLHDIFEGNSSHKLNANLTLVIPASTYTVKSGDSFKSIADTKKFGNAFDGIDLAKNNADIPNLMASGRTITYNNTVKHVVTGSATLNSLAQNVFEVSLDELLTNSDIIDGKDLLESFVSISLPDYNYTTVATDTVNSVVATHGITIEELARISKNGDVKGLFLDKEDSKPLYLNLVHLPQFQVKELLNEAQRAKALEHLSSMVSRYYFHGMRLPTDKITPKQEGMWVTKDDKGKLHLPSAAGLFALTGQQIAIPTLTKDPFTISVTRSKTGLDWLTFKEDDVEVEKLTLTIKAPSADGKDDEPTIDDYKRITALHDYATTNVLDTGLTYVGTERMVSSKEAVYPLSSSIPCQSATQIAYPIGGTPENDKPRLWNLPDAIISLSRKNSLESDPCPCFNLETHQYNEATGSTSSADLKHYGWATSIEFTIKRLPQREIKGAYQNTYEISGAGGKQVLLLERLVQTVKDNDNMFSHVVLSYNSGSDKNSTLRTEIGSGVTMGISQVNLSTVTRPPTSNLKLIEDNSTNLLNKPYEFIRLLWEACITRADGFYLYYNDANEGGLPDTIFNDKNEANVFLLVIHKPIENNQLRNYMNSVLIGDPIDLKTSSVVAQTVSSHVTHKVGSNESIYSIAMRYYSNVLSIEELNSEIKLAKGAEFTLTNSTYLVSTTAPGGKLADIANYFQMDEDEIKKVNPRIEANDWIQGLGIGIPIRLPKTSRTVGTHPGGDNIQTIAKYYGSSTAAIAGENRFIINLLAVGQQLTVATGPLNQAGSNPPGVQTIGATRSALPPFPDDPTSKDYAKNYLLYLYTMLGYTIDGNQDFLGSNIGLPLGPKGKPATDDMDKIRAVKQTNGTEPLEYSKSIHYAKMLSDGQQKRVTNIKPYESNGRLLQINYSWQDLYGNRIVSRLDQKAPNCIDTKQPILAGYTDTLIGLFQWQSMSTNWTVDKSTTPDKSFLLKTIISFDPSAYIKPDDPQSKDWKHNAFTSLATYNTLLDQLNDPNGIGFWFETSLTSNPVPVPRNQIFPDPSSSDKSHILVSWLTDIRDFLQACYGWQSGPAPTPPEVKEITLQAEVNKTELSTKQLYKLTFQLVFGRTEGVAEGDFAAIPAVQKSASLITPITNVKVDDKKEDDDPTKPELQQFTLDIENTLSFAGKYRLTVATGEDRHASSYNEKTTNVWAVRLGDSTENGISFSIPDNVPPQIFAPKPISNKLITKSANVFDYSSPDDFDPVKNKFTVAQHNTTFTDIELDKWVRQLFTDFDDLLTPEFTSSILVIDKKTNAHPSGVSSFMDSLNEQKKTLASVAKELMSPVYQKQESTRLESAKETLYQELLVKLSNLYSTRSAVSFGAKVNADILDDNQNTDQTPQLYGNIIWQESTSEVKSQVVLTSPKLGLKNCDETPLTFLVEAPTQLKSDTSVVLPSLSLALCYNGTAIEHQIAEVSGIEDYKASTWLSFVNPITAQKLHTQLITFEIPMFIRSFPLSPRMDVQTGSATNTESLADLTKWNYKFTYAQDFHYIQDRIYGKVEYNIRENANMILTSFMDAFESLAQFYCMKDTIQKLLRETVPGIDTSSSQENIDKAAKVLGAYLKMVSDVASQASAAGGFGISPFFNALVGDDNSYEFHIEESEETFKPDDQEKEITGWVVKIVSENQTPPTGLSKNPCIEIEDVSTQGIKDLTKPEEGIYAYWFKQTNNKPLMGKDAQVKQERTLVMPGLQILQRQDAKSLTGIKRNVELVDGHPSDDPFIYQTPEVTFSNPLHPTINSDQFVNIADIDNSGHKLRSINDNLTALFSKLFEGSKDTVTLQVESYYEYSPNKDSGISIPVPILMQPPLTVDLEKKTESGSRESNPLISDMINQLSSGIEFWFAENNPSKDNGTIRFKVSVMSNLTLQPMPILTLSNLYLRMNNG